MSEVANVYTDKHGRKFQYRLTENVYAPDEHGVLRLVERVPVPDDAYIADGELLLFAQSDGGYTPLDIPEQTMLPTEQQVSVVYPGRLATAARMGGILGPGACNPF